MSEATEQLDRLQAAHTAQSDVVAALEREKSQRETFVTALITHDVRTPLAAAKMSAQLLGRAIADPLTLQKLAGQIANNLDRADQMITDLLDVSRIRAGEGIPLALVECVLNEVARSVIEDLTSIHGDRFVLKSKGEIRGNWDPSALRRVLENLASNAVKYGTARGPITIILRQVQENAEISVHNQGEPIPETLLPMLFEPYHRSESAVRSSQMGWGIGLALVRGITEAHGGSVAVKSTEGGGTTFIVRIPT